MKLKNNNTEIVKEIQDRFRFVLLVAVFFFTVMSKLSDLYAKEKAGEFIVAYAALIAFYFIVYISFEILKKNLTIYNLKIINILMLIGAGMFIMPLVLFIFADKIPTNIFLIILKITIWGIMLVPLLLTAIITWSSEFKKK